MSMKQLPLEFFQSVTLFLGHWVVGKANKQINKQTNKQAKNWGYPRTD